MWKLCHSRSQRTRSHRSCKDSTETYIIVHFSSDLPDPSVDPGANKSQSLRMAAKNGHADIVRELLKHPNTDPNADNGYALRIATELNHGDVIRELEAKNVYKTV